MSNCIRRHSIQAEAIRCTVVAPNSQHAGHATVTIDAREVHYEMNRKGDRLADAVVGEADIGRQHAVREANQCLFRRIRVDRAETSQMARVERLQQIKCL